MGFKYTAFAIFTTFSPIAVFDILKLNNIYSLYFNYYTCRRAGHENSALLFAADIISAVEFDHDGLHLATGDRGGRVVLFERVNPNAVGCRQDCMPLFLYLLNKAFS
jgi:hypothetical protein